MKAKSLVVLVALVLVAKYTYEDSKYIIADNEQVVLVYRSGNPSKVVHSEPGKYYKLPFIQQKVYYGKQTHSLDVEQQILTKDYKVVKFNSTAYWKIADPVLFYKSLKSLPEANKFINDQVKNVERNIIPAYKLNELAVEPHLTEYKNANGSEDVIKKVIEQSKVKIAEVGLELNEVKINISYPVVEDIVGQP
jgi:membrane protease subunit HflC